MAGRAKGGKRSKPRQYRCTQCLNNFQQAQGLWRHIREIHGPVKYLYCGQCLFKATRRDTLIRHYRRFHGEYEGESRRIQPELEKPDTPSPRSVDAGWRPATVGRVSTTPATVSAPPATPQDQGADQRDVLSLSPTPISALNQSSSPVPSVEDFPSFCPIAPVPRGKPRGMLAMLTPTSPESSSSMPSLERITPPPVIAEDKATQTPQLGEW